VGLELYSCKSIGKLFSSIMFKKAKNIMKVSCYIGKKQLFDLEWDEMPNVGMSFSHENTEYMIINIKDSKITLKDITKNRSKKK